MAAEPAGEESCDGRCGDKSETSEARSAFGQTSHIEDAGGRGLSRRQPESKIGVFLGPSDQATRSVSGGITRARNKATPRQSNLPYRMDPCIRSSFPVEPLGTA